MTRLDLLLPAVALVATASPPEPMSAQTEDVAPLIESIRAESNAALAEGELEAFMESIDVDYVGTAGNGGHIRSHAELRAMIGGLFEDSPGQYFVRTPDAIEVAGGGERAIESGRWIEVPPGETPEESSGAGGRYTAYWRLIDGIWQIHAEIFVTLDGGA